MVEDDKRLEGKIRDTDKELEDAMELLVNYCRNTECQNCKFAYKIEVVCGLHNPSGWEGVAEDG